MSALGSLESTWNRVLAGETAIRQQQPFPDFPARPLAMLDPVPTPLERLTQTVVAAAIADAGLTVPLSNCGVVVGSSRGNQARWEDLARARAGATATERLASWLETLPHTAAIVTARTLQTTAPVVSPMAACATGLWAICQAADWIRQGYCQRVIAGAIEAPITRLTLAGFERMGALAQTGAYPFDSHREGLVLGEGGAVLVLESQTLAIQRSAKLYGRVLGCGLTADGFHVSAPEPGSRAAHTAIKDSLERSGLKPSDIDYIHAHGTATQLNDQNEACLIQQLFPAGVPVSSTKGATGHTIGASGAIGAAMGLMAIQQQRLPPCVGLRQTAFELDLIRETRPAAVRHTLCLGFGFGGQNAAIVLAAP